MSSNQPKWAGTVLVRNIDGNDRSAWLWTLRWSTVLLGENSFVAATKKEPSRVTIGEFEKHMMSGMSSKESSCYWDYTIFVFPLLLLNIKKVATPSSVTCYGLHCLVFCVRFIGKTEISDRKGRSFRVVGGHYSLIFRDISNMFPSRLRATCRKQARNTWFLRLWIFSPRHKLKLAAWV